MRRIAASLLLFAGLACADLGCADLSGLTDFQLASGDGGAAVGGSGVGAGATVGPGGSGGSGGTAGMGGGGVAGGEVGACPDDVALAQGSFGNMRALDELNTADDEDDPTFSPDGLELYFNREVLASGSTSVWRSRRLDLASPWDPPEPVMEVMVTGAETNLVLAPDGLTLWMSDGIIVVVSHRASRDASWSTPMPEDELPMLWPGAVNAVSCDRLHMLLSLDSEIYTTSRASRGQLWAVPTPVSGMGGGSKQEAWLSYDGLRAHWAWGDDAFRSDRPSATAAFTGPDLVPELSNMGTTVGDPWLDLTESYMIVALGQKPRDLYELRR